MSAQTQRERREKKARVGKAKRGGNSNQKTSPQILFICQKSNPIHQPQPRVNPAALAEGDAGALPNSALQLTLQKGPEPLRPNTTSTQRHKRLLLTGRPLSGKAWKTPAPQTELLCNSLPMLSSPRRKRELKNRSQQEQSGF